MTIKQLTTSATSALNKVGFQLRKYTPEILVVTGVVGTVVSTVLACKATTKVSTIMEKTKFDVDAIHECVNNPELADQYTVEDSKKDLVIVYAQTGLSLAKLYGPSIALGAVSITGILVGNNILRKRNLALAAAYTAVDTGFKQYRGRVIERFGDKLDKELKYGIKAKEIEEVVVHEDGTETVEKKVVEVIDPVAAMNSPYTFCFDETANGWQRDAERNKFFLLRQQDYANELLRSRGRKGVFLNEVLDMVGIPRCKAGQTVGWIYDEKNPLGDNYIDFGIFNIHREANRNFVNGLEKSIWLDFNVDGDIIECL